LSVAGFPSDATPARRLAPRPALRACALAALVSVLPAANAAGFETTRGRCVAVLDGDSIRVLEGDETIEVRLEGIDAPEHRQAFAERAKRALSDLVYGRNVEVRAEGRDGFGRVLGRVYVGGLDVNLEMVRRGLAWHYKRYSTDRALAEAEGAARARRAGLWVDPEPVPPWMYRRGTQAPSSTNGESGSAGAPSSSGAPSGEVRGNTSSRVFHIASCPNYGCRNCTARFASEEAARAAGYRPAGCCHPTR
jgi:endonuclease YncB( thermonuclease family)